MLEYPLTAAHTLLRDLRGGMTQEELGKLLGRSQCLVARREGGEVNMQLGTIATHCEAFDRVLWLRVGHTCGYTDHPIGPALGKMPVLEADAILGELDRFAKLIVKRR